MVSRVKGAVIISGDESQKRRVPREPGRRWQESRSWSRSRRLVRIQLREDTPTTVQKRFPGLFFENPRRKTTGEIVRRFKNKVFRRKAAAKYHRCEKPPTVE